MSIPATRNTTWLHTGSVGEKPEIYNIQLNDSLWYLSSVESVAGERGCGTLAHGEGSHVTFLPVTAEQRSTSEDAHEKQHEIRAPTPSVSPHAITAEQ